MALTKGWLSRLTERMRGYGSRLDDYEAAIVDALAEALDPRSAEMLRRRAAAINRVQRLAGGAETGLYQMRSGTPVFPRETALIDEKGSRRFARVTVRSDNPLARLVATLYVHDGNLASIDFNRPSRFAEAADIRETKVEILGPPFVDPDAEEEQGNGWPASPSQGSGDS